MSKENFDDHVTMTASFLIMGTKGVDPEVVAAAMAQTLGYFCAAEPFPDIEGMLANISNGARDTFRAVSKEGGNG